MNTDMLTHMYKNNKYSVTLLFRFRDDNIRRTLNVQF